MLFDAFGRFAFGQISQPFASTVNSPGVFTITGASTSFKSSLVAAAGSSALTGVAATFSLPLAASVGPYAIVGVAVSFGGNEAASVGGYAVTGQAANFKEAWATSAGVYTVSGNAAGLTTALLPLTGMYTVTGYAMTDRIVLPAASGAYTLTPGPAVLTRSGGDFDQVYGGIGHYREAIERARQLARITRKTPAPIVHEMTPRLQPMAPIAPQAPAIDLQAIAALRVAGQQAEQARILKRRRQEAEILLLAC